MGKKVLHVVSELVRIYGEKRIPKASAAMSYYLTMTIFPLIVCLYSLLGENYVRALEIVDFVEQFISAETTRALRSFLLHVALTNNSGLLIAGITVLVTTSSAAVRTLQSTIGEIQGGQRFQGLMDLLFSLVFSLAFLAAMYFAILVMFTGRNFLELINGYLPFVDVSHSWRWVRFLLLGGIELVIFWGIYIASKRRTDSYATLPGAVLATIAMVVMSFVFSLFIAASTKYPLVYGSLASLILLMFWLHLGCQVIFMGAALNVVLRDMKASKE
ncbi:MAG: YihY/virulence factor BrkB family protein [Oscillospiraceae bacterium]|nr:YihY/virulence factor BrkB family protein [Oscillospiraceae bacterium]